MSEEEWGGQSYIKPKYLIHDRNLHHQFLESFNNAPNIKFQRHYEWAVITPSVTEVTEPMRQVLLGPIQ
jgi:hypothetical protein